MGLEGGGSWLPSYCRDCEKRADCPYIYDQLLRRTAREGSAAAQRLTMEASRFQKIIAQADSVSALLCGGDALERALSHALSIEADLAARLCAQRV